jgi:hypothetical protein
MRLDPNTKFCQCEHCGNIYVLIEGYNDENRCFWCKRGIPIKQEKPIGE